MRGHPRVADGPLALLLFACSAGQLLRLSPATTALAAAGVSLLLAAAVAMRRWDPVAAFYVAAMIGAAQAVFGFVPVSPMPSAAPTPWLAPASPRHRHVDGPPIKAHIA